VACANATIAAFSWHLNRAFWNGVCVPFTFSSLVSSVSTYHSTASFDARPPGMSSDELDDVSDTLLEVLLDRVSVVAVLSEDDEELERLFDELELDVTVRLLLLDEDVDSVMASEVVELDELVTVSDEDDEDDPELSDWLELVLSLLLVVLVVITSLDDVDELTDFEVELDEVSEPLVLLVVSVSLLLELELSLPPEDVELDDVLSDFDVVLEVVSVSDELEVLDEELEVSDCVDVDMLLAVVRDSEEVDVLVVLLAELSLLELVVSSPEEDEESVSFTVLIPNPSPATSASEIDTTRSRIIQCP